MDVVIEAVALVVWIDDLEIGPGWYLRDAEVPESEVGPYPTKRAAVAHAHACGYTEVR